MSHPAGPRALLKEPARRWPARRDGYVEPTRLKVGEYLDQWLAGKAALRSNTRRSYISHLELYLRPGIGHLRLVDLRETDIERLYVAVRLVGRPEVAPRSPELERLLAVRQEGAKIRPLGGASLSRLHATLMSALTARSSGSYSRTTRQLTSSCPPRDGPRP